MVTALQAQFEYQRQHILAHLDTVRIGKSYKGKLYRKKDYLDDLADWEVLTDAMRRSIQPILFDLISNTGKDATAGLGLESSMFDPVTPNILNYYTQRATKVASDVNDETEKQLRAAISRGVADGKSTYELRAAVEDIMGSASTMRADRIARTETSRAQGYADIEAWSQSGVVEGKEFFTAQDERVCPYCSKLDGKVIGLGDNFFNKGDSLTVGAQTMQFNYDDVPAPPLHVNCRCTLLPVRQ